MIAVVEYVLSRTMGTTLSGQRETAHGMVWTQAGRGFGRLGAMLEVNYMGILQAVKPQIVAAGITSAESYDSAIATIRDEIAASNCYWHAFVAYGQSVRA